MKTNERGQDPYQQLARARRLGPDSRNAGSKSNSEQNMSNLFLARKENPAPGVVVACVNLTVALVLVCVGLFLAVTVSLLTWLQAITPAAKPLTRNRLAQGSTT